MSAKQKEIINYDEKFKSYFCKKNQPYSKTGLNLWLGVDRRDISHWRQRETKNKQEFLKIYDKACSKIAEWHLRKALKLPQYQWQYLRTCHSEEFDDLSNNENNLKEDTNIKIELINPRNIENE